MHNVPLFVGLFFILTTILTVFLFCRAVPDFKITLILLLVWLALQSMIALSGFYTVTNSMPPRFMLSVFPALIFIVCLFATVKGRRYLDRLDMQSLTIVHIVRTLVELVLFWLFLYKAVPKLMTFEGRNFDILSGLTAPVIYYFAFIKQCIGKKGMLVWNFICVGLLMNIIVNAIFSAPFPIQQFGFDQPNIAVLYFPYIWLPCCIVPLVLLSHLATIRQLMKDRPISKKI